MNDLVSIIIPVYNRATLLSETLDSIISQTYQNFECILVDDGSTDNSVEIANLYALNDKRFKVFSRPSNIKKGGNACRNIGFLKSSGNFIHWFDSDDIMKPKMIENKVNSILTNQSNIVICRKATFETGKEDFKIDSVETISNKTNCPAFELIASDFKVQTSQVMFSRKLIENESNLFNNKLSRNQETEYLIRIFLLKPKISFIETPDVLIREGHVSISTFYNSLDESEKYLKNFIGYLEMYKSFKFSKNINTEIQGYFSQFFFSCLKKMKIMPSIYMRLFFFGILYKWFPSNSIALKIFLYRLVFSKS
jgi:glycosyltransferase involved in cell wall biosynthesis